MKAQRKPKRGFFYKLCCFNFSRGYSMETINENRPYNYIGMEWNERNQYYDVDSRDIEDFETPMAQPSVPVIETGTYDPYFQETRTILTLFPPNHTDWIPQGLGSIDPPPYIPNKSNIAKSKCLIFQTLSKQSKCNPPSGEEIKKYFCQFGKVMAFKENRNNGYIVFDRIEQAQKALDVIDHVVKGCKIKLTPAIRDLSASSLVKNASSSTKTQKANSEVIHFQALLKISKVPFPSINDIKQHFEQYGIVVKVIVPRSPTGQVIFRTAKEAGKALAVPEHVINGCSFKIFSCKRRKRGLRQMAESNTSNSRCIFFETLNKESKVPPPSNRALKDHFESFGKIESFSRNSNQRIGYVAFETSEGPHKALSFSEHFVNGCKLRVAMVKRNPFKESVQKESSLPKEENKSHVETKGEILKFQAYPNKSNAQCPSPEAIERYFWVFGRLLGFQWHPQSCSGLLKFNSANSARIALGIPEHVVDGCTIKLSSCRGRSRKGDSNKQGQSLNGKRSQVQCRCLDYQLLLRISNCGPPSKRDLENYFSRFGFVETLRQRRSDPNGCVVFRTLEEARNAYSVTEHKAGQCLIKLIPKKSIPDFDKSNLYK